MIKLSFCQNDSPMGETFWQKDGLITHTLFELWLIMIFRPLANFSATVFSSTEGQIISKVISYKSGSHLICNHFSRKVVLEKWYICKTLIFFLVNHFSRTWKKIQVCRTIFLKPDFSSQISWTRFLEPDLSNQMSRTTFLHFSRKVVAD